MKRLKKIIFLLTKIVAAISICLILAYLYVLPIGEPSRPEKEYKITLGVDIDEKTEKELYSYIEKKVKEDKWKNDSLLPGKYYMGSDLDKNYFEDIYMDTPENDLEKFNVTHRFRYRWKNTEDIMNYKKTGVLPQRLEIQTKIYQKDFYDDKGYKTSLKNRYEIKNDYRLNFFTKIMLDRNNLGWIFSIAKDSVLRYKFTPMLSVMEAMKKNAQDFDYTKVKPSLYAILNRNRFHINKNTIFGYGDNGDNVFLITVDHVTAYKDDTYKKPIGKFTEIEVDFERNTLYLLFDAIDGKFTRHHYSKTQLEDIWSSFESDQEKTKNLIEGFLKEKGIQVEAGMKTKHEKIYELINKSK